MEKHPINDLMAVTMEKMREMVDANAIVGQPITTPDGVTLIPVSRMSFGFGSGGGDYNTKYTAGKDASFAGGSGAGVDIAPIAFLVVKDGFVRVLPVAVPPASTLDRVIDMAPDIMDKVDKFIHRNQEKTQE
ncbi:MAG: GerW family sporulation protein [Clostridiales bacterium]|nr:GerW family sporulation protein [bacterium 210917-SL.2.15]MCI5843779.1 GerW family sporulation protein [Clostridiales bacterium]MDY4035889.1 GerW family sporulation protein [Candidatus Pseudoscilispira sp.]